MKFLHSIMTAIIVGATVAFTCILGISFINKNPIYSSQKDKSANALISTDNEEDPTFISHLSRGIKYSSGDDGDLGYGLFENLPASVLTSQDKRDSTVENNKNSAISALAYAVTDIDRDTVIFEKDADRLLPIASITKLVTAVVSDKLIDNDEPIEITEKSYSTEGNSGKLRLGEKIKAKEMLYPLLMVSSNDAAEALAAKHGRAAFIKEMNNWVNSIGAYRTHFTDPSGLSPSNLSTARDISTILKWIKKNEPSIFDITLTKEKSIRSHTWINPTHFLSYSSYAGGKNGYTTEADRTTAALFSFGAAKRLYSVVLLGSKQRDTDTLEVLVQAFK